MNQEEISFIVESRFKEINKLLRKILNEFDRCDIYDFRLEVKKLTAFLRMAYINEEEHGEAKAVIPKLLKIFTGYVGVIQNIQLQIHRLFQYITAYMADRPDEYLKLLNDEKKYWQDEAFNLMEDNNFDEVKDEIIKRLPRKIDAAQIRKITQANVKDLAGAIIDLHNEAHIHVVRKILQDFSYLSEYLNPEPVLPESISKPEDLQAIISKLEEFKNICAGLEFMQPEYLDKIHDEKEKNLLAVFQKSLLVKKNDAWQKIVEQLQVLSKEISGEEIIF